MLNNDILDLRDTLLAAPDLDHINAQTNAFLERHGFQSFVYGYACFDIDTAMNPDSVAFQTTLDSDVMDIYLQEGGVSNDPVAERVFEIKEPEVLDNATFACDSESKYHRHPALLAFMDLEIDIGALTPVRGQNGAGSFNAWAAADTRAERLKLVKARKDDLVQSIGGLYHEVVFRKKALAHNFGLTSMELDALRYVAFGDTASDVAERLKVSDRAVEKRLERARTKLSAVNTANAIYRAAIFNLI